MIIMVNSMASRMDKYYNEVDTNTSRSKKNEILYKKMYDDSEYSNIEEILDTPKNNQIDITKVKEMLLEKEKKEESKNHIVKDVKLEVPDTSFLDDEEKSYDIMDVLNKAKEENEPSREKKYYRLDDEYEESLKNPVNKVEKIPLENDLEELKELLNTITSNMDLSKVKDSDLSLDVLSDLKTNTTLTKNTLIRSVLLDESKKESNTNSINDINMDNTFNTKSIKIGKKDYVDSIEELENEKDKSIALTIVSIILFILLVAAIIYVGYLILK